MIQDFTVCIYDAYLSWHNNVLRIASEMDVLYIKSYNGWRYKRPLTIDGTRTLNPTKPST